MTTIACAKGEMAADTMADSNGLKRKVQKIFRVKDLLVGFAGDVCDGATFVEWCKDRRKKKPELSDDFQGLTMDRIGNMVEYNRALVAMPVTDEFHAIGSGADYAIGAMESGKTPEQAVEVACKHNTYSGLPVQVERF